MATVLLPAYIHLSFICWKLLRQRLLCSFAAVVPEIGSLRVFNWLNDILFSWICKKFQKNLDGELCIFLVLYIPDLFWRTYAHKDKQEMKKKKKKVGTWDYGSINLHIVPSLLVWCMLHSKKTLLFSLVPCLLLRADYSQAIKEYWWSSSLTQVFV